MCKYGVGLQGLSRIRAIYAADNAFKKVPPAKRKLTRNEHVRPLIDAFFGWVRQAGFEQQGRSKRSATPAIRSKSCAASWTMADCLSTTRAERSLRWTRGS